MRRTISATRALDHAAQITQLCCDHGFGHLAPGLISRGASISEARTLILKHIFLRDTGLGFSFKRIFEHMCRGDELPETEREILDETQRAAGKNLPPGRVMIPYGAFYRDLTAGEASAGGYLVNAPVGEAADTLWPWSVAVQSGINVIERVKGTPTVPNTQAKATVEWLADEFDMPAESQPSLGSTETAPHTASCLVQLSRKLNQQADVEGFIRRELLRTAATAIDQAVFSGSGVSGQPLGLINTTGVNTISGASITHADVNGMKGEIAGNDAPDTEISFIGTPSVRTLLEGRERATGSGFIWNNDQVSSRPAFVTTDVPADTLVCGAWPTAVLMLWGPGVEIEINPYNTTAFRQGVIEVRVMVSCDVAFIHPSAFVIASSVS